MKEHGVKPRTDCVVVLAVIVHQAEIALEVCALAMRTTAKEVIIRLRDVMNKSISPGMQRTSCTGLSLHDEEANKKFQEETNKKIQEEG